MRSITKHVINPANDKLSITVSDKPGAGGAQHRYEITGFNIDSNPSKFTVDEVPDRSVILFQNGPIAEAGVNGVTHEALLAILIDRLESFQAGPYQSEYNADALAHLTAALNRLQARTLERMSRGVEGTTAK